MNYEFLYIANTIIIYMVMGVLTAALAGLLGYLIWLSLTRGTVKYYIKNAMNFFRLVLACFIVPFIPFLVSVFLGRTEDQQIVMTNSSMRVLILPVFVLWFYKMGPVLKECRQRYIGVNALCEGNVRAEEEECYAILDKWKKRLKLHKKIEIFYNSYVTSPSIVYHRGYKLLLPVYELREEELNMVILHELIHCRHHDLPVKNIALIANVIHCFHPICFKLRRDIDCWAEVDCDFSCCEVGQEEFSRKEYFNCILELRARSIEYLESLKEEEDKSQHCNLYEGDSLFQFRVEMMHKMEKDYKRIPIGSFMVTVVLAFVLTIGTWRITVKGMEFWYTQNLTYEKHEVEDTQRITDVTVEEFFEGTEVIRKSTDILNPGESTELTVGAGETWVFDVAGKQVNWAAAFAEGGQEETIDYRAGYIDDSGRLVYAEGDNTEINTIYGTEDEGIRVEQIVIRNQESKAVDIELLIDWKE